MSLVSFSSGLLALCPKVRIVDGRLYSRSHLLFSLLTLFLLFKRVIVDPAKRTVTIKRQLFWLIPYTRTIDFDEVQKIDYDYTSLPTRWSFLAGTEDEVEWFTIKLCLYTGKRIKLWTFFGEGAVTTGWSGVLLGGDEAVDWAGTQEDDSRYFLEVLQFFLKKPIV